MRIRAALGLALLGWVLAAPAAQPLEGPALLAELRKGGYTLYLRHTSTDFSQNDRSMTSFEDCATQRNLTAKGREDARRIGEQIRRLRLPVGDVLASPFCRTVETAKLAFGKAKVEPAVRGGPGQPEDPRRYDPLRKLLGEKPGKGTNRVVSSHGNPFYAVFGPPYLAEGEVAVLRPLGRGKSEIVARITPERWTSLGP